MPRQPLTASITSVPFSCYSATHPAKLSELPIVWLKFFSHSAYASTKTHDFQIRNEERSRSEWQAVLTSRLIFACLRLRRARHHVHLHTSSNAMTRRKAPGSMTLYYSCCRPNGVPAVAGTITLPVRQLQPDEVAIGAECARRAATTSALGSQGQRVWEIVAAEDSPPFSAATP